MAEICENRGPRIGEDVAYCALPAGHLGSHIAHRDWGRNRPEWRNHDAQPISADSPDLDRLTLIQPDLDASSVSIAHSDGTTAVTFHGDGRVVVGELNNDRLREAIEAASETLTGAHARYEAELRQARAQLTAVQRIVDHPPFCGEVHVDDIRDALALHGVPHEWVQTTRLGSRDLEYVCAYCDQTKTEPRPDCTTDQENTRP